MNNEELKTKTITKTKWLKEMRRLGACSEALKWAKGFNSLEEGWQKCERGDWMLWLIGKYSEPESDDHRKLVLTCCQCARLIPLKDKRSLAAIETAEKWVRGENITLSQVKDAADAADAAAADAIDTANTAKDAFARADRRWIRWTKWVWPVKTLLYHKSNRLLDIALDTAAVADAAAAAAYTAYAVVTNIAANAANVATYAAASAAAGAAHEFVGIAIMAKCAKIVRENYPNYPIAAHKEDGDVNNGQS